MKLVNGRFSTIAALSNYKGNNLSLAGVRSNRGDNFQTLVAFDWALSILTDDKYQWLEVDSTSLDGNGATLPVDDIVIRCIDGSMICCQCKKNQKDFKPWSISDLGDELTKAALFLTTNTDSQVKFYSRNDFGALAKLREHSRTQPDCQAFLRSLSQEHNHINAELEKFFPEDCKLTTYEWLQRTTFEVSPEFERAEELLKERLRYQASNAENAFNAIWTQLDK